MATIIVACDPNGVIGKDGTLPWRLPEDLRMFRELTLGHPVIMGTNTWKSIPKNRKPLDDRANLVVSRSLYHLPEHKDWGPFFFVNLAAAIRYIKKGEGAIEKYLKEPFIIGGAKIYELALKEGLVDTIIMSRIHQNYEGDVHFPKLGNDWDETSIENKEGFDVVTYKKIYDPAVSYMLAGG